MSKSKFSANQIDVVALSNDPSLQGSFVSLDGDTMTATLIIGDGTNGRSLIIRGTGSDPSLKFRNQANDFTTLLVDNQFDNEFSIEKLAGSPLVTVGILTLKADGNLYFTGKILATEGVDKLTTASGVVSVAAAIAPTVGQVLTATSATVATWQAATAPDWLAFNNGNVVTVAPIGTGTNAIAIGNSSSATSTEAIAIGDNAAALLYSVAVGTDTIAGNIGVAIGWKATCASDSIAIGRESVTLSGGTAIGQFADADSNGVSIGTSTNTGQEGIAIGRNAASIGTGVSIGTGSDSLVTNGVAVGSGAQAGGAEGVAIGRNTKTELAWQVAIGAQIDSASVTTSETFSTKIGYGVAGVNLSLIHLMSSGKLELYGTEAQFVLPNYLVGSPALPTIPITTIEGGMIWDASTKELKIYDGTSWSAIGGIASVFDDKSPELGADLNVNDFNIVGKPAATVTSAGGDVNIAAADGGATSGDGGDITLIPGTGSTDGIVAVTGNMEVSGTVKVNAALAISSTNITASYGDALTITSGDGVAVGSTMKIISGAGDIGGNVVIEGGNGSSTTGGAITIKGGYGYNIGGQVRILGGYGYHTTAGVVILTPGHTYAGNDAGKIIIESSLSSNIATEMRFNEGESNGAGYVALKAPDSITTASRTWILPDDDPNTVAGQFLTTSSTGELSFVSGLANPLIADLDTGGFDFIAPDSATVTADSVQITAGTHTGAVAVKSGGTVFLNGGYTNSPGGDGGAIRLIAGNNTHASDTASPGGRVELRAGTSGPSRGGHCEITGGDSTDNTGGDVIITGGYSTNIKGGGVKIEGGYTGYTYTGGDVTISGGRSYSAAGGNVILQGGVSDNATAGTTIQIHRAKDETGQAELQFWDDTNTGHTTGNYVALKAPAFVGSPVANITFVLPELDGAAGDVLQTDGTGNLGFGTAPIRTPIYTLATLPTVVEGAIIYVSDATGNSLTGSQCFGNATVWVDVTTGAAVA